MEAIPLQPDHISSNITEVWSTRLQRPPSCISNSLGGRSGSAFLVGTYQLEDESDDHAAKRSGSLMLFRSVVDGA